MENLVIKMENKNGKKGILLAVIIAIIAGLLGGLLGGYLFARTGPRGEQGPLGIQGVKGDKVRRVCQV